ncbi:MAG: AraC family transcriptional regulator [Defluviitaleaceae bacterium]|nr:AraC family transcriptional regulator [Defluviitaleaceae bacterium]
MNSSLLQKLYPITQKEKRILDDGHHDPALFNTEKGEYVIDTSKLIAPSKSIEIHPHTRFAHCPKHRHNFIEIVYMCKGSIIHLVNDIPIELKAGDLLFLSQRAFHEILPAGMDDIAINFIIPTVFFEQMYHMLEGEKGLLFDFIIGSLFENKRKSVSYLYFNAAGILPVQNLVENLVYSIIEDPPTLTTIQKTMALLMLYLMHYVDKMQTLKDEENQLAVSVLQYIDAQYKTASLAELSRILHYDQAWLSREIKKNIGKGFKELVQDKRMSVAAHLLTNTQIPVSRIIENVGYENQSFFYHKFKAYYQSSPTDYRVTAINRH